MKKYLSLALAMPLLFACSNDLDVIEEVKVNNDPFAGIEKVDATFTMAEPTTRMETQWIVEDGDSFGFAWMGDGTKITNSPADGNAYQNHPLIVTGDVFKPQTSIYVGKYYVYRPYDKTVVEVDKINFNSLKEQTVKEGRSLKSEGWKGIAKNAILIGDQWTTVTKAGDAEGYDKAGIDNKFHLYSAFFSNQTALDLKYTKNNPKFDDEKISGASDIEYTYPKNSEIGAADIYDGVTVQLEGAPNSFKYAPTATPTSDHIVGGTYWEDKKNLDDTNNGFYFNNGAVTLNFEGGEISTGDAESTAWFWFNSLPKQDGAAGLGTKVTVILPTTYGEVKVEKTLEECASAFDFNDTNEWYKFASADDATNKEWAIASHNTFVNQYGNHKGKYALTVDFSTGKMSGMHIKDDAHLQKALKYYIAAGKDEPVSLNLDGASATDKTFKLSKISIALLQTINASANKVTLHACASHNTPKIIITQDGQEELGLGNSKEVPALNKVFDTYTAVYLSKDCEWTWSSAEKLPVSNVSTIINEGNLTVKSINVQLSEHDVTLKNAADATMNFTKVTTVKNRLTNLGTINVGSEENKDAELRAYNAEIINDATSLIAHGEINNYGVVGVSEGTTGKVNNYGLITMKNDNAITLLTSNEISSADFDAKFDASSNKKGTVVLPKNDPCAIVSVSNTTENGFIMYEWKDPNGDGIYSTPAGIVKYNTIVVSSNIEFTETATEIQYIVFNGTKTKVVNYAPAAGNSGKLTKLQGVIVNDGKSIIIEKTNGLKCKSDAYLGAGATVYNGGNFTQNGTAFSGDVENYFGTWKADQIVKY